MEKTNKYQQKAQQILQYMKKQLAIRYVNSKINHWLSDEFINVRDESLEYWQIVKTYLK